jgi:hypothetical protein
MAASHEQQPAGYHRATETLTHQPTPLIPLWAQPKAESDTKEAESDDPGRDAPFLTNNEPRLPQSASPRFRVEEDNADEPALRQISDPCLSPCSYPRQLDRFPRLRSLPMMIQVKMIQRSLCRCLPLASQTTRRQRVKT